MNKIQAKTWLSNIVHLQETARSSQPLSSKQSQTSEGLWDDTEPLLSRPLQLGLGWIAHSLRAFSVRDYLRRAVSGEEVAS